jgi:hypothetical protein
VNLNEDEQKNFESVLGVRWSIVTLAATTGNNFCYLGSCIQLLLLIIVLLYVDHKKTDCIYINMVQSEGGTVEFYSDFVLNFSKFKWWL